MRKTFDAEWNAEEDAMNWREWIDFLKELHSTPHKWQFTPDSVELLKERTEALIMSGVQRGQNSNAYAMIMAFDLKYTLMKMSVVQAVCQGRDEVQVADVEKAYIDLSELWDLQLNFITRKIKGRLDYQENIDPKLLECLLILDENGAHSFEESTFSINDFDEAITSRLGVSLSSARNTYRRKLKDKGLINSKQVGSHDSRVCLTKAGLQLSP